MSAEAMWKYTAGEVVLSVPYMSYDDVKGCIVDGVSEPEDVVHIPLSKVDYAITSHEFGRAYAFFVIGGSRFYVLDSPRIRGELENTAFENLFRGDDQEEGE